MRTPCPNQFNLDGFSDTLNDWVTRGSVKPVPWVVSIKLLRYVLTIWSDSDRLYKPVINVYDSGLHNRTELNDAMETRRLIENQMLSWSHRSLKSINANYVFCIHRQILLIFDHMMKCSSKNNETYPSVQLQTTFSFGPIQSYTSILHGKAQKALHIKLHYPINDQKVLATYLGLHSEPHSRSHILSWVHIPFNDLTWG